MAKGDANKPKGRMSAYTYFVQTCREEHRKKHPNENVNFTEFSKKCAERWKQMTDKEKKRFADMAERDKTRYEREMANYVPPAHEAGGRNKRRKKDPNAPKRPLSAFFLFCHDERPGIKAIHPTYSVGEVAKDLGERWSKVSADVKAKYESKAATEKLRYDKDMASYKLKRGKEMSNKGDKGKPKGRMSNYTFFVQMCREEHRKKHPNENVNFTEFSKKCAERWKQMTDKEKKRFADMAERDKQRYDREMATYTPPASDNSGGRHKRKKKDPNAPKRPLSAFFLYCADERPAVKALYPNYSVGEAAKELGERWNKVTADVKAKYEAKATIEKGRYERESANYKAKMGK